VKQIRHTCWNPTPYILASLDRRLSSPMNIVGMIYADYVDSHCDFGDLGTLSVPVAHMYNPEIFANLHSSLVYEPRSEETHVDSDTWNSDEQTLCNDSDDPEKVHAFDTLEEDPPSDNSSYTNSDSSFDPDPDLDHPISSPPPQPPRHYTQPTPTATRLPCKRTPLKPGHFIEAGSLGCAACRDIQQRKIDAKLASGICIYGGCTAHLTPDDVRNKHVRCARHREKRRVEQRKRRGAGRS